jgi:hypothetical protein
VSEELNDERKRRCYLQDFHDSKRKKVERRVLFFYVSEGGDVFLFIETGGVNLYARMIDDAEGLEVYHESSSAALPFELVGQHL